MYEKKYHTGDISNSKFLVTGGAGFIGSGIVEYLMNHGAEKVRVIDNFSTGYINNIKKYIGHSSFELMQADIRDSDACKHAVSGMNYVLHQAALGSVPRSFDDPVTTNSVNIIGFLNMLVAAKDERVKMVYAACSSSYGDSADIPKVEHRIGSLLSPYAVSKYVNELYGNVFSRIYEFNTIGLRYFNVFGPRQNPKGPYAAVIPVFINAALNQERPVINGDGKTSRDFTFVENVIQANLKALFASDLKKHEVFNVASGESVSLNELWKYISEIAGTKVLPVYNKERKGDIKHSLANTAKAEYLIGYKPTVNIRKGLEKAFEWYMQNKPEPVQA
jgi:UDP-N-acetylglucosamine 4-epimerase